MKKMITAEEAKAFTKKAVKKKRKTEIIEPDPIQTIKVKRRTGDEIRNTVSAGFYRPIIEESIARVTAEIWPGMEVRDQKNPDVVDIQLKEMAYILGLTMAVGNDDYTPRQGVRMKEASISDTAKLCKECR